MDVTAFRPFVLVIQPQAGHTIETASVVAVDVGKPAKRAIVAFSTRARAAMWRTSTDASLELLPVRSANGMDRLAAIACVRLGRPWLCWDPNPGAILDATLVGLAAWLRARQPWDDTFLAYMRDRGWSAQIAGIAGFAAKTSP